MNIYYADTIAQNLVRQLAPYCVPDRLHIAGSVRRKKEEVKDIEIVCIPVKAFKKETNLFGEVIREFEIIHPGFENTIRQAGTITKGKFTGRYMQIEMKPDIHGTQHIINLDLFMPQPHDYYRQLAIRTGSADFAKRYLANKWVAKGWCGCDGELRMIKECYKTPDEKWHLKSDIAYPAKPPVWQSEKEFFTWLGIQYYEPQHRSL